MNARKLGAIIGVLTLAASGGYVFVYLARWEWNRALMSGVIFLAAEIGLVAAVLAGRIKSVDQRLAVVAAEQRSQVLERLRESRPPARVGFSWLTSTDRTNVFVPVLMGAGVLMSGIAWIVERLAKATAGPAAERGLAGRLDGMAPPAHGPPPCRPAPP